MIRYIKEGQTNVYRNTGTTAIEAGTAILVGSIWGIATREIKPGEEGALTISGVFGCIAATTISAGQIVYLDDNQELTTSGDNPLGFALTSGNADDFIHVTINRSSGGSGADNYNSLSNKPKINNITLQGNQTAGDLGFFQQVDTIPDAAVGLVGRPPIQYNGATTTVAPIYTHGYFYECKESTTTPGTYEWVNVQVQSSGSSVTVDNVTVEYNASSQLQIKDGGVGTAKIADSAVTTVKLNDESVTYAKMKSDLFVNSATDIIDNPTVIDKVVTPKAVYEFAHTDDITIERDISDGLRIVDGGVNTAKIADNAVTTVKINAGAVTYAKMDSSLFVTTATEIITDPSATNKIVTPRAAYQLSHPDDDTLEWDDAEGIRIRDGGVSTNKLVDGSVTTAKLYDGAVTKDKLDANLIVTSIASASTDNTLPTAKAIYDYSIPKLYDATKPNVNLLVRTDANGKIEFYEQTVMPTITISAAPTSITEGTATNITLTFQATKGTNELSRIVLKNESGTIEMYTVDLEEEKTKVVSISSSSTFEVEVKDDKNNVGTASVTVTSTEPPKSAYFGKAGSLTTISNVTSKSYTGSLSGLLTTDTVVYKYPQSFGNLSSVMVNGDECVSAFTKTTETIDSIVYNVYTSTSGRAGDFIFHFN